MNKHLTKFWASLGNDAFTKALSILAIILCVGVAIGVWVTFYIFGQWIVGTIIVLVVSALSCYITHIAPA